jgi:hypothetical protein
MEERQISDTKEPVQIPEKKGPRKVPDRIVLFAQDIVNITGLSLHAANRLIRKIRKAVGKPRGAFITVKEFCAYCHLREDEIEKFLRF